MLESTGYSIQPATLDMITINYIDYENCNEDQCIVMIQEMLQVENLFHLQVISDEGDTQLSLKWVNLEEKRVEEDYGEGCKTRELRKRVGRLVDELVGVKKEILDKPVVQKIEKDKTKGMFVTVGNSGTILTSSDGISWTTQRTSGTSENLWGVTYGNGLFVNVG